MTTTIAEQLARFVCECRHESLPVAVANRTKLYILDTLGAIQIGATEQSTQIISDIVLQPVLGTHCTAIGRADSTTPLVAALINGAAAHAVEIDDDHRQSALHPGAVVVPAALAASEYVGANGKTFLAAVAAGYEVAVRVGMAMGGTQDRVGFHSTSTCGVFGAAVAAGSIFGLTPQQMATALGIAGSQACGLQEWKTDGSWTKRLHAGKAAESGVLCAMMAERGYTGPNTVFEGNYGFLKAYSGTEQFFPEEITRDLGIRYLGAETAFKPYACCRFSHPLIDAVRSLKNEYGFTAQDVERCEVRLYRTGFRALFETEEASYRPRTIVDAQFSAPFIVALALQHDTALPHHFTQTHIDSPQVQELMDCIHGQPDDDFESNYPDKYGTEVRIELKSGQSVVKYEDIASGDPMKPEYIQTPALFKDEVAQKYRSLLANTEISAANVELLIEQIDIIEQLSNVRELSSVLRQTR